MGGGGSGRNGGGGGRGGRWEGSGGMGRYVGGEVDVGGGGGRLRKPLRHQSTGLGQGFLHAGGRGIPFFHH